MSASIKKIPIKDLCLWTENPRDIIEPNKSDLDIIKQAILNDDKERWNLPDFTKKMGEYYELNKLPIVVEKNNKYIVYDGNRRIAILKYLQNPKWSSIIENRLFPLNMPQELKELLEIPCCIYDEKRALDIIYKDSKDNNTWSPLQQCYFEYKHLKHDKPLFLKIEEETGIISANYKALDQRYVKDELLIDQNLQDIGFSFNEKGEMISNYTKEECERVFKSIIQLIEKKKISTRNNRGLLKKPLEEIGLAIKKFDNTKKTYEANLNINHNTLENKNLRKTKTIKPKEELFGKTLSLKPGTVNNLYSAICKIYDKFLKDESVLPILGMSLRLVLEVAGREYLTKINDENKDKDSILGVFLSKVKKELILEKKQQNFLFLTNNWLDGKINLEGILGKYAHGQIAVDKGNLIQQSKIVGDILEHYFGK